MLSAGAGGLRLPAGAVRHRLGDVEGAGGRTDRAHAAGGERAVLPGNAEKGFTLEEAVVSLAVDHLDSTGVEALVRRGTTGQEVADPWYTRDFEQTWLDVNEGCQGLLAELTGTVLLDFSLCADIPALYQEMREKMAWEDWYGENLDALYDVLTGLQHRGSRFVVTVPRADAPPEVRLYFTRILRVFRDAGVEWIEEKS